MNKALRSTVRISNEIARGESLPTLTKTKGFRALLLLAESSKLEQGPVPGDIYEVPFQTLRELLRCNDDEHLKSELEDLAGIKVNWSRINPDLGGYSIPVSSCIWQISTGKVLFAFDPQFVKAWQDNLKGFRRINWEVLVSFRSNYAAKIYEYVSVSHVKGELIRTRRLNTEELREVLAIPTTAYSGNNAGRFYQEISKAVKQVNDAQDGFKIAYRRDGRGGKAVHWFEVEDAPKQERMPLSSPRLVSSGDTRRARIDRALAGLPEDRRAEVVMSMIKEGYTAVPDDDLNQKIYASRLRTYGVEL